MTPEDLQRLDEARTQGEWEHSGTFAGIGRVPVGEIQSWQGDFAGYTKVGSLDMHSDTEFIAALANAAPHLIRLYEISRSGHVLLDKADSHAQAWYDALRALEEL